MHYSSLRRAITLAGVLFGAGFLLGCMTVVKPVSSSEAMTTDDKHGMLFGGIHLTQSEKDLSGSLEGPMYMKWRIQEETDGTHILLSRLPLDGPFAVKLPTGSYRVTDVSFHTNQGVWHTEIPTTFRVLSGECTSLGLWKLELQNEFRAGWLTRKTFDERKVLNENDTARIADTRSCPIVTTSPDSGGQHAIRLSLYRSDQLVRP